jgi:hypothetical protein
MKLAIMQPYFFPYIGYWQLMHAVDTFVIYDDVNFITRGWINRNRILINGAPHYITVPLEGASQNKRICDIDMQDSQRWRTKLVKSIASAYGKSPFYSTVYPEIERQLSHETNNLAEFLAAHLTGTADLLGIETEIVPSSRVYDNDELSGQERILDICRHEGASIYVNLPGGKGLYDPKSFGVINVDLAFLSSRTSAYRQRANDFVPNLSVIDALMETGTDGVAERLCEYDLEPAAEISRESKFPV